MFGFSFVCTRCKIRPINPQSVLMLSSQEKFQVNLVIKQQSGDKNRHQPLHARDKLCAVPAGFPVIIHRSVWNSIFLLMVTVRKCEIYHMHYLLPHPCLAMVLFASVDSLYVALMGEVPRLISTRQASVVVCVTETQSQLRMASSMVTNLIPSDSFHIIFTSSPNRKKNGCCKGRCYTFIL